MCSGKYTSEPLIPNFKCGGPFPKALVHSFLKFSFLFYDTLQQKHPNFLLLLPIPHWLWQYLFKIDILWLAFASPLSASLRGTQEHHLKRRVFPVMIFTMLWVPTSQWELPCQAEAVGKKKHTYLYAWMIKKRRRADKEKLGCPVSFVLLRNRRTLWGKSLKAPKVLLQFNALSEWLRGGEVKKRNRWRVGLIVTYLFHQESI